MLWAIAAPLLLLIGAGATGAVAALGDTLFHSTSLAQGMHDDAAATAHLFIRLRALHPLIAGLAAVAVLASASVVVTLRSGARVAQAARVVRVLVVAQVAAGIVNLVLLAPVAMQLVHLTLADAVWIAVVAMGARALEGTREWRRRWRRGPTGRRSGRCRATARKAPWGRRRPSALRRRGDRGASRRKNWRPWS